MCIWLGSPGGSDGKDSACNAGDPGSIPGLGRSPGKGNGNPLQYSCMNSMNTGATGSQRVGHNWATNFHFSLRSWLSNSLSWVSGGVWGEFSMFLSLCSLLHLLYVS